MHIECTQRSLAKYYYASTVTKDKFSCSLCKALQYFLLVRSIMDGKTLLLPSSNTDFIKTTTRDHAVKNIYI